MASLRHGPLDSFWSGPFVRSTGIKAEQLPAGQDYGFSASATGRISRSSETPTS